MTTTQKTYDLDGTLLEACSCAGPCPCWVGDDPDGGTCDAFVAYHIDRGQINGVDVSGLSLVNVAQIPGNVLAGNWRLVIFVDSKATTAQQEAILNAFGGKLGGPLADLAGLVGEIVTVHSMPIEHRVEGGKGTLRIGTMVEAEMGPYTDASQWSAHHTTRHRILYHPRLTSLCCEGFAPPREYSRAWHDLGVQWTQCHPGRLPLRSLTNGSAWTYRLK